MKITNNTTAKGTFRFKTYDSQTGELKRTTDWIDNKIVSSNNHGLNMFLQHLVGNTANPLEITQAKIGTGTTPTILSDTDLETPVLDGILRANFSLVNNVLTLEFFITDAELTNGSYTEYGLFCLDQLFARAIISPAYTKASNEDTIVEYIIELTSI